MAATPASSRATGPAGPDPPPRSGTAARPSGECLPMGPSRPDGDISSRWHKSRPTRAPDVIGATWFDRPLLGQLGGQPNHEPRRPGRVPSWPITLTFAGII